MTARLPVLFVVAFAMFAGARTAHADCAAGATYSTDVTDNTVKVCPENTVEICAPMLRQNEDTGELVQLNAPCNARGCRFDECVPAGTYRYGYVTPFTRQQAGCGNAQLFTEATVANPLPPKCTSMNGPPPTPATVRPPWGESSDPMIDSPCPGCLCSMALTPRQGILSLELFVGALGLWFMRQRTRKNRATRAQERS